MNKLKVFILTYENSTICEFWNQVIKKSDIIVEGAAILPNRPSNRSHIGWLLEYGKFLGMINIIKLLLRRISSLILGGKIQTVKKLFDSAGVENRCYGTINDTNLIHWITGKKIDLIISVQPQILSNALLSIPTIGCLNKHDSLLPEYRSIFPLFWALFYREKVVGITVHFMTLTIDKGPIIAQRRIKVNQDETLAQVALKCWKESSEAMIEALHRIKNEPIIEICKKIDWSISKYYKFPSKEDRRVLEGKGVKMF